MWVAFLATFDRHASPTRLFEERKLRQMEKHEGVCAHICVRVNALAATHVYVSSN